MRKSIVTVAALVIGMVSFAQTSKVSLENSTRESIYNLKYVAAKASRVTVKINDTEGRTILEDEMYGKNFIRPYNFNQLPQGSYNVLVKTAEGTTELALKHNGEVINPVHAVAVKSLENDRFELTVIGNNADVVTVFIYDNQGQLVHTQDVARKGSFSQVYDLAKVSTKGYTVEVVADAKTVSKITL